MPKVIVSHIAKQHVNYLLEALEKGGVLKRFYTAIAGNKLSVLSKVHPRIKKLLDKKHITLDNKYIHHFPFLGFSISFFKTEYKQVKNIYTLYDRWVSQQLKPEDFDVLIGYETCNMVSFRKAKQLGKTTILDLASIHHQKQKVLFDKANIKRDEAEVAYISSLKEEALRHTDYVFCLSSIAKQSLLESGFEPKKIYQMNLGVNNAVFTPKKVYNTEGVLNLYFVGRMTKGKGLGFLTDVLTTLICKNKKIHLTLIGGDDDFTPPLSIAAHITRIPFVTHAELAQLHHQFDLFLYPSVMESWGMAAIEAMASGSPVLISENAGAKDAVEKGGGEILSFGNVDAWVNAIEKYDNNRRLLEEIGKQAAKIAQKYTWEAYHKQVMAAVHDIINHSLINENYVKKNCNKKTIPQDFTKHYT